MPEARPRAQARRTAFIRGVAFSRTRPEAAAWAHGLVAGLIGAAIVIVVLLGVDLAEGRPLWTPAVLGAALFEGERLVAAEFDPWARLEVILGYTAVHGVINVGFGAATALFLLTAKRARHFALVAAATTGILFLALELSFLAQALLFAPRLADDLAAGWVAAANALAAAAMGVYLARYTRPVPKGVPPPGV